MNDHYILYHQNEEDERIDDQTNDFDPDWDFLQLNLPRHGTEKEHLREISKMERNQLKQKVKEMVADNPGIKIHDISKKLCPDPAKFQSFNLKIKYLVHVIRKGK